MELPVTVMSLKTSKLQTTLNYRLIIDLKTECDCGLTNISCMIVLRFWNIAESK